MGNKRKAKCGYCGKVLKVGEGSLMHSHHKQCKFYYCSGGCPKRVKNSIMKKPSYLGNNNKRVKKVIKRFPKL